MPHVILDAALALLALAGAVSVRPWRGVAGNLPWPWLAAWAITPLLWGIDRYAPSVLPPMSGAALLVLLAGWPLAIIAFVPSALVTVVAGDIGWIDGLHRLVWLGIVPATFVLALGAAVRRWLPRHLFVYILGRGFAATLLALVVAGALALPLDPNASDVFIGRVLLGFGEAFLTGMLTASLVAFRPHLLATYADRLYLPDADAGR
ncbi:MAG TPA: hypothetical protein VLD35_16100 [Caldimonas sp.]|nr:hypothetical protein [Caldimonas sp.]